MSSPIRCVAVFALCSAWLACVGPAYGQQEPAPLRVIRWYEARDQPGFPDAEIIPVDGPHANVLEVRHTQDGPADIRLLEIVDPGVTESRYAISGQIRYEDVSGDAYLELISELPNGKSFFTRTLAETGPLERLSGSSGWRDFRLPADRGDAPPPDRLLVNLHLEGPGKVYLTELRLADGSSDWSRPANAWWSDRSAGLIGGLLGSVIGIFGALAGTLASIGRGRAVVLVLFGVMGTAGAVSLATGIVAVLIGQPYGVWYTLCLIGLIGTVIGFAGIPMMSRRYAATELRRMQALDAGA